MIFGSGFEVITGGSTEIFGMLSGGLERKGDSLK
jgi:hypothetical protein